MEGDPLQISRGLSLCCFLLSGLGTIKSGCLGLPGLPTSLPQPGETVGLRDDQALPRHSVPLSWPGTSFWAVSRSAGGVGDQSFVLSSQKSLSCNVWCPMSENCCSIYFVWFLGWLRQERNLVLVPLCWHRVGVSVQSALIECLVFARHWPRAGVQIWASWLTVWLEKHAGSYVLHARWYLQTIVAGWAEVCGRRSWYLKDGQAFSSWRRHRKENSRQREW